MNVASSTDPIAIPGSRVKVAFGAGNLNQLGKITRDCAGTKILLVSDPGIVGAGHCDRAIRALHEAHITAALFSGAAENPTTQHVAAGVEFARDLNIDLIVGLGGGSSMDCAKGINFILTNGGRMQDYWGVGLAKKPLLPMIAIPTTAGTGSDAQSFALITDPQTHQKMACGDPSALPRVAILDSDLTATQPKAVAAATGIDAIAHAVETAACNRRNSVSREFSRQAWELLDSSFESAMRDPGNSQSREKMLLGAHLAGAAIENSMLGAAHSVANALTAVGGVVHGVAVGLMLPHVVRFNSAGRENPYADLSTNSEDLAGRIEKLLIAGNLPTRLSQCEITEEMIPRLAAIAVKQWTATFNPRPVSEADFAEIFRWAL